MAAWLDSINLNDTSTWEREKKIIVIVSSQLIWRAAVEWLKFLICFPLLLKRYAKWIALKLIYDKLQSSFGAVCECASLCNSSFCYICASKTMQQGAWRLSIRFDSMHFILFSTSKATLLLFAKKNSSAYWNMKKVTSTQDTHRQTRNWRSHSVRFLFIFQKLLDFTT